MKYRLLVYSLLVVAGLYLTGCDANRVFEEYRTIPSAKWEKDSVEVFQFAIFDIKQKYNLYINVRNDIKYNYSNLWLFIETDQPNGITLKDTRDIVLAETSGKWLGKGFGGAKTLQVKFQHEFIFPYAGIYKIKIKHGMREDVLNGIRDIGFRVEKQH